MKTSLHDAEVPVYTFGMRWDAWGLPGEDPAQPTFEVAVLRELAVDSGGRSMVVDIPDLTTDYTVVRMIAFVQDIAAELRGQYTTRSTTPPPRVRTLKRQYASGRFHRSIRCVFAATIQSLSSHRQMQSRAFPAPKNSSAFESMAGLALLSEEGSGIAKRIPRGVVPTRNSAKVVASEPPRLFAPPS
jgi:hypothetical protein